MEFADTYKNGQAIDVKKAQAVRKAWLELEKSAVGRFAPQEPEQTPAPHAGEPPVNVGDTPWLAWAGIAAAVAAAASALYLRFGRR